MVVLNIKLIVYTIPGNYKNPRWCDLYMVQLVYVRMLNIKIFKRKFRYVRVRWSVLFKRYKHRYLGSIIMTNMVLNLPNLASLRVELFVKKQFFYIFPLYYIQCFSTRNLSKLSTVLQLLTCNWSDFCVCLEYIQLRKRERFLAFFKGILMWLLIKQINNF